MSYFHLEVSMQTRAFPIIQAKTATEAKRIAIESFGSIGDVRKVVVLGKTEEPE